jgi:hypothetical protein
MCWTAASVQVGRRRILEDQDTRADAQSPQKFLVILLLAGRRDV